MRHSATRAGAARARPREAHHLPPTARGRAPSAALVQLAASRAADLAARGLEHGVRRHEHHLVRRVVEEGRGDLVDPPAQRGERRGIQVARLGEHDDPLGLGARIDAAEDRHAALAHARQLADRLLELVRVEVASGADDDVLDAAGQVDVAAGDVGQVARLEPAAVEELARLRLVAEVAASRRRAAELEASLAALGDLAPGRVDDADLVARKRPAAGDELERVRALRGRRGPPGRDGRGPSRSMRSTTGRAPERRKREPDGALGQPVDRRHRLGPEAVGREALGESPHRRGADRLGAVRRKAPGAQVEPLEVRVVDPPEAQLVAEVRRGGERGAVAMDRPEPALRPREERSGERITTGTAW